MSRLLSILMPVYNERASLERIVARVLDAPLPPGMERELVMVEDHSTDGTAEVVRALAAKHPGVIRAFFQERNQGKGAAIRRAIAEMRGQYALFQDADLEYDPRDYPALLAPLLEQGADAVYGSRFAPRAMRRTLNFHHALGNRALTLASNWFTRMNLTDMETCYKAFRADLLRTIPLRSNRFGIEPEITAKVAKRNAVVYEVPISYHGRGYDEGKKIGWKDGVSAIWTILKFWIMDDCYDERTGRVFLTNLGRSRRFMRWLAQRIVPRLGRRVLELGSGLGQVSRCLPKRERLTVTDSAPEYLALLGDAFRDQDRVDVRKLDPADDRDFEGLDGAYDSVVAVHVLEYLDDDTAALRRFRRLLEPRGKLALVVPQYRGLFGPYDRALGHRRRYSKRALRRQLADAGFRVVRLRGYNFPALLGWWINSNLLRRRRIGRAQIKLFDLAVPWIRLVERLLPLPGLSLVVLATRGESPPAP